MAEETPEIEMNEGLLDGLPAEIPDPDELPKEDNPVEAPAEKEAEEAPVEEAKSTEAPEISEDNPEEPSKKTEELEKAEDKPIAEKAEVPVQPVVSEITGYDAKASYDSAVAYNKLVEDRKAMDARVDAIKADKEMDVLEAGKELSLLSIERQRLNEQLSEVRAKISAHEEAYQKAVKADADAAWAKFGTNHKELADTPAAVIDEGKKLWKSVCDDVLKRFPGRSSEYLLAKAESVLEDKIAQAIAQKRAAKTAPPAKPAGSPPHKVLPAAAARTRPPTHDDPYADLAKTPGIGSFLS
jgi:hypothetical protein